MRRLLNKGFYVCIIARKSIRTNNLQAELSRDFPNQAEIIYADLSNQDETIEAGEKIVSTYPEIDLIVYAAGVYHNEDEAFYNIDSDAYPIDVINETLAVGLTSPMLLTRLLVPIMGTGSKIITISGTFDSAKGWLPYYVGKKALEAFTVGLSEELEDRQIHVNCISPGDTITESYSKFFPELANANHAIKPDDIVDLFDFLVSDQAKYVNGQIVEVVK